MPSSAPLRPDLTRPLVRPMPRTILGYVVRFTGRHQIGLALLSVAVFALSAVPLELQRRIVNDVVEKGRLESLLLLAAGHAVAKGLHPFRAGASLYHEPAAVLRGDVPHYSDRTGRGIVPVKLQLMRRLHRVLEHGGGKNRRRAAGRERRDGNFVLGRGNRPQVLAGQIIEIVARGIVAAGQHFGMKQSQHACRIVGADRGHVALHQLLLRWVAVLGGWGCGRPEEQGKRQKRCGKALCDAHKEFPVRDGKWDKFRQQRMRRLACDRFLAEIDGNCTGIS